MGLPRSSRQDWGPPPLEDPLCFCGPVLVLPFYRFPFGRRLLNKGIPVPFVVNTLHTVYSRTLFSRFFRPPKKGFRSHCRF